MERINQVLPVLKCERCGWEDPDDGRLLYEANSDQELICVECITEDDDIYLCRCGEVLTKSYDDQQMCGKCIVKQFKNDMLKRFFAESDKETKRDMLAWVYDQRITSDELLGCAVEGFIGKLELHCYFNKLNPWEAERFLEAIENGFTEEAEKWLISQKK